MPHSVLHPNSLSLIINFLLLFQDGLEFSPPRIHSPYYNIDDTCNPYAKDEKLFLETFQKHYNYPQKDQQVHSGAEKAGRTFAVLFVSLVVGGIF